MRTITTLTTCNRNFTIVYHQEHYCAVEDIHITDGKINKKLTGFELHASKRLQDCIDWTIAGCTIQKWIDEGMDSNEALIKYYKLDCKEV